MAIELIQIKDGNFPKTDTINGTGLEYIVVSKADGITYGMLTSDFKDFLGTVQTIAPKPISPSDPAPTLDGIYLPEIDGTYTNLGGIVVDRGVGGVDYGKSVQIIKEGSTYIKYTEPMPQASAEIISSPKNLFNPASVITGKYIDPTTYAEMSGADYSMSDYIPATAVTQYALSGYYPAHYAIPVAFYNSAKTLIGGAAAIVHSARSGVFTTIANTAFIRFTLKTAHPSDHMDPLNVQLEQSASATPFDPYKNVVEVNSEPLFALKAVTNPLDLQSPVTLGYLDTALPDFSEVQFGKNKFNAAGVVSGFYIDVSTGALTANANYSVSPFIPVITGKTYTVSGFGNVHYGIGVAYYNSAQVLIANTQIGNTSTTDFKLYATMKDVAFVRFTVKTGNPGDVTNADNIQMEEGFDITAYESYKTGINKINATDFAIQSYTPKTKGKHMFLFGDSITDTSLYNYLLPMNYPYYMANILESSFDNFALSGASFTDWAYTDGARQQLSKQVDDAILTGVVPDIVLISIGTNDYIRQSQLGDYDTAMGKATLADLDRTLVLEAARWAFWRLRLEFPDVVCFYANPLQRVNTSNGTEANNNGNWLRDPVERMARRYNFIVIDQYGESGIVKDFEVNGSAGRFLHDGLHTNQAGKAIQGKFVANEILNGFSKSDK